jgi:antitoxin component YwqK of YwqJK toxin-antitoxin module
MKLVNTKKSETEVDPITMSTINYNNRKFHAVQNTKNGETSAETVFHYHQEGNILSAEYSGGQIIKGHLIGLVDKAGSINMRYHQVNSAGELMTGICQSKPEILENGKILLHESWQWTSGDGSKGESILEEI